MTHAFHDSLPGYHPDQILHDGCDECEQRAADLEIALAHLDRATFRYAWERAARWQKDGCGTISRAEAPLLKVLWAVQVRLEDAVNLPAGTMPIGPQDTEPTLAFQAAIDQLKRATDTDH